MHAVDTLPVWLTHCRIVVAAPYIQARLLHLNSNFEELMQLYFKFDAFHAYGASLLGALSP
jgi:hypothetical protein